MLSFILATISTTFIVICGILIALGWRAIRQGDETKHQKLMVTASIFALAFFVIYMSRTTFIGNVPFNGPESLALSYHIFLIIHIVFATLGAIFGLISLYLGYKQKFVAHRKVGPYTAIIWFITAISGPIVYLMLFIIWPNEADSGLIKAIFGL
ncbi:DUF420 domain-containing protein [Tuberibacillus sp. Marseille-P3662]|uniref:DUF420 domain-containing protein n=1 Tax=Tuberibacillus sp. Marseille-P3662 TaxID=1965358 RepID=UPI000A1CC3F4|nr:DUF420 domain-containing protein [Tuberibacillus sp. Marseille-P3662]